MAAGSPAAAYACPPPQPRLAQYGDEELTRSRTGRLFRRLGQKRWFAWLGSRFVWPLERALWLRYGRGINPRDLPELLLVTQGRRTGRLRAVPVLYLEDDGHLVIVASNWGNKRHPAWSENLLANPTVEVRLRGDTRRFQARLLEGDEKQRLWPRLLEIWPAWSSYQERTDRDFRMFLLTEALTGSS
ncbi:MAG TPA: nitroreductase family deazaflavin-dependent oxidoreductase [Candidatus Dormibacteraeota bacterium]|nr:nitroreductase family deazaflavin-dependent oxidoreductase [Candidatus Dormibacteraeota bacterium]